MKYESIRKWLARFGRVLMVLAGLAVLVVTIAWLSGMFEEKVEPGWTERGVGLLVDDPITDVENIARYFTMKILPPRQSVLRAVQEVRPALILSTLAIIVSFLPLAFITGMMGPYMAPMALNVPLTVTVSTLVAFVITPWLAMVSLKQVSDSGGKEETYDLTKNPLYRLSSFILTPILSRRIYAWGVLLGIALLLVVAMIPPVMRWVPVKMLLYDNKNEFQVVVDMPEGTTLERTDVVSRRIGRYLGGVAEVSDYEIIVGAASPMDFNRPQRASSQRTFVDIPWRRSALVGSRGLPRRVGGRR